MAAITTRASRIAGRSKPARSRAGAPSSQAGPAPETCYPALAELIAYLRSLTGRADLKVLHRLLNNLRITRRDIEPACAFGVRGYRRNTIARSDHFELLALCWRSGHCTPIHNHTGVSCAFRVVHGRGTEIRFTESPAGIVCPVQVNEMPEGYVCSAEEDDIHQVANHQAPGRDLVTLHIYSPPIRKMHVFCYPSSNGAENQVYDAATAPARPAKRPSRARPAAKRR